MAAVIAAPAIVLAGAGIAAAQTSPSTATPSATPSATPGTAPADAAPRAKPGGPDAHQHGHHHRAHHPGPRGPVGAMGVRPDADGNVSRTDVQAAQQRQLAMFDKIDANHDGVISKDERMAFHRQMRDARQPKAPADAPATAPSKG